jgi:S-formylglutathione hydrolase FrmB
MRNAVLLLRAAFAAVLGLFLWTSVQAKAATVDYLMVPSAAMGRDIPVAFMAGGPHAVYLLDAFDAGDTVSNWVNAGTAMTTLAGTGVSVAAPAGGAYSLYTTGSRMEAVNGRRSCPTSCPTSWPRTRVCHPTGMRSLGYHRAAPAR